jgi:hypothetical protein
MAKNAAIGHVYGGLPPALHEQHIGEQRSGSRRQQRDLPYLAGL